MDDARLARVQEDLVAWGVLAENGSEVTPRFRAALARAAATLQRSEAAGVPTPGDPVRNAVRLALRDLRPGDGVLAAHVTFVAAIELASYPPEVRALLGWGP